MGAIGLMHHFHPVFQAAAAFTAPPIRPASAPIVWVHPAASTTATSLTATSTSAKTRRCLRNRDHRPYSLLFASKDSREPTGQEDDEPPQPPPLGSAQDANAGTDSYTNPREGQITPPSSGVTDASEPTTLGEQTPATTPTGAAGSSADGDQAATPRVPDGDGPADGGGKPEVDWDKAWASTRQKMEKERKDAPAFSGRKQVVATKNSDGDYDFVEISADGSRRQRGEGGSGGFGFADGSQAGTDGRGRIQDQEQEAVNLATTNKAFAALFAVLAASFIFEVYIYLSGGITNGSTRFEGRGQPTTYDTLPMPATPTPGDDLSI